MAISNKWGQQHQWRPMDVIELQNRRQVIEVTAAETGANESKSSNNINVNVNVKSLHWSWK